MRIRSLVPAALVLSALLASCSGGPAYTSQDLEGLVTRPSEVPEGFVYARTLSGLADLEEFRSDAEGRAAMRDAGFRVAYTALIASPGLLKFFTLAEPGEEPPANGKLISSAAVLFGDDDGAARALDFFERDLRTQFDDSREVPAEGLGEAAFGLEGTQVGGRPAQAYAWQVGPIYEAVLGQGEIDPGELLRLARAMHERAL